MTADLFVIPGMRICATDNEDGGDDHVSGPGTYALHGYIYSSLVGIVTLIQEEKRISVQVRAVISSEAVVPKSGDLVTAKILCVNPRFAKVHILCVRDQVLSEPFRGQIRKEDIRATEKDKVEMYKSFRPGDIVLCRVISLGEVSTGFLLSTAENELGVVIAYSSQAQEGTKMIPVSWTEMQCPKTYNKEYRKIAKVAPEELDDVLT